MCVCVCVCVCMCIYVCDGVCACECECACACERVCACVSLLTSVCSYSRCQHAVTKFLCVRERKGERERERDGVCLRISLYQHTCTV